MDGFSSGIVWTWLSSGAGLQTISVVVTAFATLALGYFTYVLARETRRLSRATAQAHVVATLEPNQWTIRHVDLVVANTGNAAAHDITVSFEPPLVAEGSRGRRPAPLSSISLLKPGQSLTSHLGQFGLVREQAYVVTVGWKQRPTERVRQNLRYSLAMSDYEGVAYLGARSPLMRIAEEVKNLREDWRPVAIGGRRLRTDVFTDADRQQERKELDELYDTYVQPKETE
jgi:hypothetical protein